MHVYTNVDTCTREDHRDMGKLASNLSPVCHSRETVRNVPFTTPEMASPFSVTEFAPSAHAGTRSLIVKVLGASVVTVMVVVEEEIGNPEC